MTFTPFQVKAVYEYTSPHEDDLHFSNGQIITVVEEEDEDWYAGEYTDADGNKKEGIFPRNFVEKYQPQAPPRPVRTARPKKEAEPASEAVKDIELELKSEPVAEPAPMNPEPAPAPPAPAPVDLPEPTQAASIPLPTPTEPAPAQEAHTTAPAAPPAPKPAQAQPAPPPTAKSPPPPAAEKPTTGSFRDRIAAFNKAAAPPPVPYKPGGAGSGSSFIRKPFVAPPPSKNAYIPPPRDVPVARIYRREEDPEIAEREHENQESAEKAGLAPSNENEEEQPKPTSLKERIALLQKQQAEQAARHADAAAKKEKPKKPVKKHTESHTGEGEAAVVPTEHAESQETTARRSFDQSAGDERPMPARRKSSRGPPPPPARAETDGNDADMSGAADDTEGGDTGVDDSEIRVKQPAVRPPAREPDVGDEEDTTEAAAGADDEKDEDEDEEEEEEDDIDPEVRRKEEIRARMAKMSGGMGMHGMFGPPGGMPMPPPPQKKKKSEKQHSEEQDEPSGATSNAPPVPIMALPGLSRVRSPEEIQKVVDEPAEERAKAPPVPGPIITSTREPDDVADIEDIEPKSPAPGPPPAPTARPAPQRASMSQESFGAPPVPGGRPAPPPIPTESRPVALVPMSPSAGSASDDEMSMGGSNLPSRTTTMDAPRAPPAPPSRDETPQSPQASKTSYFGESNPASPNSSNKRASRVPPIPGAGAPPPQSRAPPPLPPTQQLSRQSTADVADGPPTPKLRPDQSEGEVTEYEGDYDTDIGSSVPHKDALKSTEEQDDDEIPHPSGPAAAPPLPPTAAPRMPPPLPSQPPQPPPRQSADMPRAAPPPPPPAREHSYQDADEDEEYDPYNYSAPKTQAPPAIPSMRGSQARDDEEEDDDLYTASPPRSPRPAPAARAAPPPPPRELPHHPAERAAPPPPPRESVSRGKQSLDIRREPARQSLDVRRDGGGRRSVDMNRMVQEHDFIANDIEMGGNTLWWLQPNGVPPAFHGRRDILHEAEESTEHKRGGKSRTTKDLYVLFPDYSQTIITVRFDPQNPQDASFEQRHEPPPAKLRPDQLEENHERYGRRLYEAVAAKKDTVVGDGTPLGLVIELLKPLGHALLPVGTRAFGALVYSNQGNSLTSQLDEIRPGDIITFRNAKFQGKHGPMHAKYSVELGKSESHVGIVAEWDGARKKVRAWEQGRESKKVKVESFKLEDLRSGEVRIWRVMGRAWVGWEGQNS